MLLPHAHQFTRGHLLGRHEYFAAPKKGRLRAMKRALPELINGDEVGKEEICSSRPAREPGSSQAPPVAGRPGKRPGL